MISQAIVEPSQVAAIRRAALDLGYGVGLPREALDRVALVVTEAGTNLLRHATEGRILVLESFPPGSGTIHVVAVDSGPGIPSVEKAMEDGFTTARGPGRSGMGTGLGAIRRQSDRLDIYSDAEGTVVVATIAARPCREPESPRVAGLIVPKPGFSVGGDAWAARLHARSDVVMLIDVLGHGPTAGAEAAKAVDAFVAAGESGAEDMETAVSQALAAQRGAAVLIVEAGPAGQPLKAVGLGNVRGEVICGSERHGIPSTPGIAGASQRRPHPTEHDWPAGATLLLTTDGLKSTQRTPEPTALMHRDALTIAAALYQRRRRDTDDCGVVVLKARP
ncbi:MAG: ATP-binding protein [Pararhizobium sp.]